ncbi:MAG: Fic family protein [Burkholderiaceae bacterium]|jgi:Fic family protein|nr:Fic family protein [Burkholderiaceae bacterium]
MTQDTTSRQPPTPTAPQSPPAGAGAFAQSPMELLAALERVFPKCDALPQALSQLDDLKQCLDSFRPLNPAQLARLLETWDTEYTYESNRIEGNTLTLQETYLVIAKGMTIKGKKLDEHLEARNHQEAIHYIRELAEKSTALNEYLLNSIHNIVLGGIRPREAGIYRQQDVTIAGARHVPPQTWMVKKLMEDIFLWYGEHKDSLHPVLLAADMHEKIVSVHPWIDGNGRTSRLVMNLILMQHGFPIARIAGDDQARLAYYNALEQAQTQDNPAPFRLLVAAYVRQSLFDFLAMVSGNTSADAQGKGGYFFARMAGGKK